MPDNLAPELVLAYKAANATKCPFCGAYSPSLISESVSDTEIKKYKWCSSLECNKRWTEVFEIVSIEIKEKVR